ncbi:anthrone oxygenase family protein [Geodermatophilus sp. SYSU D00703]
MLSRPLALLTAVLTGLLAGGMVLIEAVLLPFWRAASPADFRRWFTEHSGRIRDVMIPLGAGAGTVGAASAAAHLVEGRRNAPASVAAALATAGVIGITVTVNEPANHRFTAGTLTDPETTELLARWARWHHVRVFLGLAAAVAAASALTPNPASTAASRPLVARGPRR